MFTITGLTCADRVLASLATGEATAMAEHARAHSRRVNLATNTLDDAQPISDDRLSPAPVARLAWSTDRRAGTRTADPSTSPLDRLRRSVPQDEARSVPPRSIDHLRRYASAGNGSDRHTQSNPAPITVIRRSMMRGDKPMPKIKKGWAPPTTVSLLLGRYEAIINDEGLLKPADLSAKAAALFKNAVPAPVLGNPLEQLTTAQLVAKAVHELSLPMTTAPLPEYLERVVGFVGAELAMNSRLDEYKEDVIADLVETQLLPYVAQAELALYGAQQTLRDNDVRQAVALTAGHNPNHIDSLDLAARLYLAAAPRVALAEPAGQDRHDLIIALESMPIVKALYSGNVVGDAPDKGHVKITHTEEAFRQDHFMKYYQRFIETATTALAQVYGMVEPTRLPPVDRIKNIEVNPDEVKKEFLKSPEILKFRPDANRQNDKVRLSVTESIPKTVHELGHQVEFALPIAVWLDLIQILQDRAGGQKMVDIYGDGMEIAFAAAMPAFTAMYPETPSVAKYAAKIYEEGDTEVLSMSMEALSEPDKARKLVNDDPLLAATVLRSIRPLEFHGFVPPNLRALLPRGDV